MTANPQHRRTSTLFEVSCTMWQPPDPGLFLDPAHQRPPDALPTSIPHQMDALHLCAPRSLVRRVGDERQLQRRDHGTVVDHDQDVVGIVIDTVERVQILQWQEFGQRLTLGSQLVIGRELHNAGRVFPPSLADLHRSRVQFCPTRW